MTVSYFLSVTNINFSTKLSFICHEERMQLLESETRSIIRAQNVKRVTLAGIDLAVEFNLLGRLEKRSMN